MIQIAGAPLQQSNMWQVGTIERMIIQRLNDDPAMHAYQSMEQFMFEVQLRRNIILSARAMSRSHAQFAVFSDSRCNPRYWVLTRAGGFLQRPEVKPSDAIQDIYMNSGMYAFECATAMVIIYYHAVLNLIGEALFNQVFQNIYLYSWHADPDLGLQSIRTPYFIPGDVVYFSNPDFDPRHPEWRGENAVLLGDGTYFAHGVAIKTGRQMIYLLNQGRRRGSNRSAYLEDLATRPSFEYLAKLSMSQRSEPLQKHHHLAVPHNETSMSFANYSGLLHHMYNSYNPH